MAELSLSTGTPKTSWAFNAHLFIKEVANPETVLAEDAIIFALNNSTNGTNKVYDLGLLDEDGFSVEVDEGDKLELRDINGVLQDSLRKEGTINISFTIVKPSESTRGLFWQIVSSGVDGADHLKISSLVTSKHYVLAFGNVGSDAAGTEAVVFPYCSVAAKPVYSADKGWTLECSAEALKGGAATEDGKFFFDFVTLTNALLGITE